jgi:hypothetical protein
MLKKTLTVACAIVCCINYATYTSPARPVHKDDFKFEIKKIAQNYIESLPADKKFSIYDIPTQLKPEYEGHLTDAQERLDDIIWNQGYSYVDSKEVEKIVKQEVDKFVKTMSSIVLRDNIDKKINDAICDLIHKNGIIKDDIKKYAGDEYDSRYYKVRDKLTKTMSEDYRTYVKTNEIEKTVSNEFLVLIKRVKNQINESKKQSSGTNSSKTGSESSSNSSWQGFWDWLSGKNTTSKPTNTEPSAPPYNYAGEKCSICLENLKSHEKLGYLNCGHYFHESCIKTSMSHYALKCPLCDTYTDSVAYTVIIPVQ